MPGYVAMRRIADATGVVIGRFIEGIALLVDQTIT
jgi:hypothetical protein